MAQVEESEEKMQSSRRKVLGIDLSFLKEWWKKRQQSKEESRTTESEAPKKLRCKCMKRREQKKVLTEHEQRVSERAQDLDLQEMQLQWQERASVCMEEYAKTRGSLQITKRQKLSEQKQKVRDLMQELSERELRVEEREQRIEMMEQKIVEREKEIESRQRRVEEQLGRDGTQPSSWVRWI